MKKSVFLLCLFAILLVWITPIGALEQDVSLKTAFIRNNDLWTKIGNQEKQVTQGNYIRNPKWSFDGKWLTFTKGKEQNEVWLYHTVNGSIHLAGQGRNAQWAPKQNILAFQTNGFLTVIYADEPDKHKVKLVVEEMGNYSWMPDGSGFLVSTVAKILSDGKWKDIELYKIVLDASSNMPKKQLFCSIPSELEGFFAVMTSPFKWSPDGKWIAFIAKPTASLSADGNTLCFLSSDARSFVKAGQMLDQIEWFDWAPKSGLFAYIEGAGRLATLNKRLTVVKDIPFLQQKSYTPAGYVDNDFAWQDDQTIITSRAKEAEWSSDESQRPMPFLVRVDLTIGQQTQLTSPPAKNGDYLPVFVQNDRKLSWVRTNRNTAEVMLAAPYGKHPKTWIRPLTLGSNFYERWNWSEVIHFY